jgi:glucan phosphoethanolaminetransferase (alkaline phosphatase superfamily)
MSARTNARIPCTDETKNAVQARKRGGEPYDELLQKMLEQYDPDKAHTITE